ncbi:hypothetical protein [Streptodolium elevatio]
MFRRGGREGASAGGAGMRVGGSDEGFFAQKRRIASAALLVVLLLTGLMTIALGDDEPVVQPQQTGAAPAPPPPLPPLESCPEQPEPDGTEPRTAPVEFSWSTYHGLAIPFSSTAGPHAAEGDVARCFARTPAGAIVAALQISARYSLADDWRPVLEFQVAAGHERDAAMRRLAERAAAKGAEEVEDADPRDFMQVAGYQVISFSADAAAIRVARGSVDRGTAVATIYSVEWIDGDWRLRIQPNGAGSSAVQPLKSLAGFTPWGPESKGW